VVGVTQFTDDVPPSPIEIPNFEELADRQRERLARAKAARDATAVTGALGALRDAATQGQPLMSRFIDAVRVRATIGEMSGVLKELWGAYAPPR
jgi:methylmalonyl-CoA mutase N-terminal domain/subunit